MISRRQFLWGSALGGAGAVLPRMVMAESQAGFDYVLVVEAAPVTIMPDTVTPALCFNGGFPAPVLRARQGERLRVKVVNRLAMATTVHWHGIRIDNAMDGVPWLTQKPIAPGDAFVYDFVCPDAGTFWYHPHMHSIEQLGKGLVGVLVVEEQTPPAFDADVVLGFKDWRLAEDGSFLPLSSPRQAARAGTLGTVATVNGEIEPVIDIPAGGAVRARLANIDNTRVIAPSLKDYPAQVLALDGMPLKQPRPLTDYRIGAGMRMDIGFIAPKQVGEEVVLYNRKGRWHFEALRFRTVAADGVRGELPALAPNPIAEPDLNDAETLRFVFEWAGALSPVDESGEVDHRFWTINRRAWEGASAESIPAPLARLRLGKTYRIQLHNPSPHPHPIHLHGLIFTVLSSSLNEIEQPWQADTVLLEKNETVEIAVVADNPGRWMFHCHVIEHMKTGLMGYLEIA